MACWDSNGKALAFNNMLGSKSRLFIFNKMLGLFVTFFIFSAAGPTTRTLRQHPDTGWRSNESSACPGRPA